MPKVTLMFKSRDNLYYEFFIENSDVHIMNTLRRTILAETVTLAIHDVYINQNTSVIPDEVIAQRLGLIPLRVEPSELNLTEEAAAVEPDLKRLYKLTARLRLRKINTEDTTKVTKVITVYSGDLESIDKKTLRPVYDNIPIVKLGPKQEIDLECIAKVGRGKDHAKFSPVSTVAYKIMPTLNVKDNCTSCGECVNACPYNCLEMELGKPVLKSLGLYNCDLCRICVRHCPEKALEIEPNNRDFIFRIKLIGQLQIDEILDQIDAIFERKLDYLVDKIEESINEYLKQTTQE
ncbi:MAG: DNA-directed RNA polymerase subunit D [Thermosphaera sp.]